MAHMCGSQKKHEDISSLALFFNPAGPGDQIEVVGLGSKHLYQPRHLVDSFSSV